MIQNSLKHIFILNSCCHKIKNKCSDILAKKKKKSAKDHPTKVSNNTSKQ